MAKKAKETGSAPKVRKTYKEINEKILARKAVVLTAEEMISVVEEKGAEKAAREVDVVTTGTTTNECARVLRRAGADKVDVIAVAVARRL